MIEISSAHAASSATSLAARVLELIAGGQATSRAELSERLGAAASTVSMTVQQLLSQGLLAEEGTHASTGGRPRKVLRLGGADGFALAADLGGSHARIGVVHSGGELTDVSTVPFTMADGPEQGLSRLADTLNDLAAKSSAGTLRGVGVSLPGPVDLEAGSVSLPSRMPGWTGFRVRDWLEERFGVTAAVDNDANLMALGEHSVRPPGANQSITVKAGTAIGVGIIADGRVYRGATGAAGDITHVRLPAGGDMPCSCGNTGCLETVASGAALVRQLRERGLAVESTTDVVRLAADADPEATRAVRRAGRLLGEVLSANVNFFNPDAVYLGGVLSTLEPFVAAVRSQLYEGCHPLATEHLVIERARTGADAGLVGAGLFALQRAFTSALDSLTPAHTPLSSRMPRHYVTR
jgi:predicted NBD/HSP70 family sugar kinase